jgi:hypothetical protein
MQKLIHSTEQKEFAYIAGVPKVLSDVLNKKVKSSELFQPKKFNLN